MLSFNAMISMLVLRHAVVELKPAQIHVSAQVGVIWDAMNRTKLDPKIAMNNYVVNNFK
mgnify:CR=1 FL=1